MLPILILGGSGNPLKDATRKIQFKLEEKDCEEFQRDLDGYNRSLKLLLQLAQVYVQRMSLRCVPNGLYANYAIHRSASGITIKP